MNKMAAMFDSYIQEKSKKEDNKKVVVDVAKVASLDLSNASVESDTSLIEKMTNDLLKNVQQNSKDPNKTKIELMAIQNAKESLLALLKLKEEAESALEKAESDLRICNNLNEIRFVFIVFLIFFM